MGKMQSAKPWSEQPLPLVKLTSAGTVLCDLYCELTSSDRRKMEDLLLKQAFLPNGTNSYLWNRYGDRLLSFLHFRDVSHKLALAWLCWAEQIFEKRPSRVACQKAILGLIGHLVQRRNLDEPAPLVFSQRDKWTNYKFAPLDASEASDGAKRNTNADTKTTV